MRPIVAWITIRKLDRKGNCITDREFGQSFAEIPINLLLAPITEIRHRNVYLLLLTLIKTVGDGSLTNAMIVPTAKGKVEISLKRCK
ncbi:hypothetical protein OAF65_05325 [Verrucomicrobiales bacterium]|nr:hypothetical protein [Verrucomicrobiales bacterium]